MYTVNIIHESLEDGIHCGRLLRNFEWFVTRIESFLVAFYSKSNRLSLSLFTVNMIAIVTQSYIQGEAVGHEPLALEPEISLSLFAYFPAFPSRSTNSRCSLRCHVTLTRPNPCVSSPCGDDGGVEPAGRSLGVGVCNTVLISSRCMEEGLFLGPVRNPVL
jgi:hypothetical protein